MLFLILKPMKTLKYTLILALIFVTGFVSAQNTYTWTGNGVGSLNDAKNWSPIDIPGTSDTLVFNSGGDVHVTVPLSLSFAGLRIENSTTVYFESVSPVLISFDELNIHYSTLNLDASVNLTIQKSAEINSGILSINSNTLTLNGDYYSSEGYIGGTENSRLIISGSNAGMNNIYLSFAANADSLYSVTVNRTSDDIVNIGSNLFIKNNIDLTSGKIRLNDNSILSLDMNATINADQDNYIITQPHTFIEKQLIAGSPFLFPTGTNNFYAPVKIIPNSDSEYSLNASDTVYSEGNYGTPFENNNVKLRWKINTSDNYELTLTWPDAAQYPNFDPANSYISHFNETEWDNPGLSVATTASGYNSQTRTISGLSGFFSVFSGTNSIPAAADNSITTLKNKVYIFNTDEFNYSDSDGDAFAKIMITQAPLKGTLFLDANNNGNFDTGENLITGNQVLTEKINEGLLKFAPLTDDYGIPYTNFNFRVSDGFQYSANDNSMTINVSSNRPPNAPAEQIFTIPEHSPQGTVVGKIDATDPDGDNVYFYPQEGVVYSDAFNLADDGTITVNNSNLLEYSINPSFVYRIDVCDDGVPVLCTPVKVTINLEQVIRNIEAANFISPNGDGHNDRWLVKGIEEDTFEAFIFNKSGKLLFHSSDYKNGWDGTSRGKELPPGVYYYLLKSPTEEFKGTITLVR